MLKEILSISGRTGLYKLIARGKNMLIVESLNDQKRMPAYSHEKIIALGDIAIFTTESEAPLREVLENIKAKENGAKVSIDLKSDNNDLRDYFSSVMPNFDRNKVYLSDMKKIINWYNILIELGMDDFSEEAETEKSEESENENEPNKDEESENPEVKE